MKYKVVNTSINKMDGTLKITVKLPERYNIDDIMNSIDETVKEYGDYRGHGFYLSSNFERCYVFETTLPYSVYKEKQDSVK